MKTILILICFSATLMADGVLNGPASRIRRGAGEPSAGTCASVSDVGKVWVRTDQNDTSTPLRNCSQTGPGTFAWVSGGGGGSGSGASAVADLTDCKVTYSSGTVISVGACAAGVGNYNNTAVAACSTSAAPSSSGTLRVYIAQDGTYTLGYSGANTATCTGWTTATSISAFPYGSFPISTITWTSGAWNNDAVDERRLVRSNPIAAGADMDSSVVNGVTTLNPATATIPRKAGVVGNAYTYATTAGSSTAYTLATPFTGFTANANGVCVLAKMDETSGATPTLSVNSETARQIWKHNGTSAAGVVASGELIANQIYEFCHNTSLNTSGVWLVNNPGGGGGGGATIAKTAYASLPGTCTSGNLYLFTDSSAAEFALCGASNTYSYFRDGFEITLPPTSGSFTAVTTGASGTAAISTANGGLTITAGSNSGNAISNAYMKALANGTTFTLTVALQLSYSNSTYPVFHFGLSNGTGATADQQVFLVGGVDNSGTASGDAVANLTDYGSTTFVSDVDLDVRSGLNWRRIRHAAGTRYYEKSSDGINWTVFYSTTTTTHITPTHYYFRLAGRGAATVVHLKEE